MARHFEGGDIDPWYGPGYESGEVEDTRVHGRRYGREPLRLVRNPRTHPVDMPAEDFIGLGPRGYRRADELILDDVGSLLTDHPWIDASDMTVSVSEGEVTLTGTVPTRRMKRLTEDTVDLVSGVQDVHNQLRLRRRE